MKNPKRVLWIAEYFPRPHNLTAGVWALEMAIAIQKQGVEVVVLSPTPWIPQWLAFTPTVRKWSSVPYEFKIKDLPIFYPKCPHYPHRLITRCLYNFVPFFDGSLIWHWCKETISRLLDRYPFQVVHSNFIFPSGFIGLEIKNKYGIPLVVHEHALKRLTEAKNHLLRRSIYSQVVREADMVITPNHKMANLIRELLPNRREINVIKTGIDIKTADSLVRQKPEGYKGKRIILSVGSLVERKGHEYLVRAISHIKDEFPDIKCIIIGSGIRLESLENLINKLALNNVVELYGQRPHDEVLKTMSWCDVFVLPSWDESFGTVYAEAMAFSKPIIACSGEGIGEVMQGGVHGLFVRKQDEESLAEALKKILSDQNLASRLGREGRALAEKELNWGRIASQIIDLYKRIVI